MRTIPLTRGKVTVVDDDAPAWIFEVKWYASCQRNGARWYARRNTPGENGRRGRQFLHRIIMDAKPGEEVDHKFGDGLDNRKDNLRITAYNQRGFMRLRSNNLSGFRGVSWYEPLQKFKAQIPNGGKRLHLGYFDCKVEAARVRDTKARELGWPEEGMNFPQ